MNNLVKKPLQRIQYIEYLRFFSACAVILLHVSAQSYDIADVHSFQWTAMNLYDSGTRWAVPCFIMISGLLFLNPDKTISVKSLYSRNLPRIALAYFFWSAVYSLYRNWKNFSPGLFLFGWFDGEYHLWYLLLIAGLYMTVPLIRLIAANKNLMLYTMVLQFVMQFVIPQLLDVMICLNIPLFADILYHADMFWNNLIQYFPTGYLFYFLMGHFLAVTEITVSARKRIYACGIFAYLFTVLHTQWYSLKLGYSESPFYGNLTVNVAVMAISVFLFTKYELSGKPVSSKLQVISSKFSSFSFGVYLIHVLILNLLKSLLNIHTLSFHPIFSIPVIFLLVLVLSWLSAAVIKNIPVLKHFIT